MKITRVLHAGYIFEEGSSKIIFDPIFENPFSVNCHAYPNVEFDLEKIQQLKFDAVFISHFHDDHCSFESLNLLKRSTPICIYCLNEEMLNLIRQLGFENVHSLQLSETVCIGSLKVTPHRALDEEVDCIFQISSETVNVLNVVDSWIDYEKVKELSSIQWNLILWPFQTMRELEVLSPSRFEKASGDIPFEWVEQLQSLKPLNLIPSSCQFINEKWSWYNYAFYPISYQKFISQMQKALQNTQIFKLHSGASIKLSSSNQLNGLESVDWITPVGSQDVDYEYKAHLQIPSPSEVASHFQSLTASQKENLDVFCDEKILNELQKIDFSSEPYFQQEGFVWRLKIYEDSGSGIKVYNYRRIQDGFELVKDCVVDESICWLTEISDYKLWCALYEAEAMTSLYIRINDCRLAPAKEKSLKEITLTEDPLLRVLYDNRYASYQKKQLTRIRTTGKF